MRIPTEIRSENVGATRRKMRHEARVHRDALPKAAQGAFDPPMASGATKADAEKALAQTLVWESHTQPVAVRVQSTGDVWVLWPVGTCSWKARKISTDGTFGCCTIGWGGLTQAAAVRAFLDGYAESKP